MKNEFWDNAQPADILQILRRPLELQAKRQECLKAPTCLPSISVVQITSHTLKIGDRIQSAFETLSADFPVRSKSYQAKKGTDRQAFISAIKTAPDDFILLHIHARENEERLLEPFLFSGKPGRLVVFIHRPEEYFLRTAEENGVSYEMAGAIIQQNLRTAEAVVLPGAAYVPEYERILPSCVVTALPLGFVPPGLSVADMDARINDPVEVIGSNTTWGEMRHLEDLINLHAAMQENHKGRAIVGYVSGAFDARVDLQPYIDNGSIRLLANKEIEAAYRNNRFDRESGFRKWLHARANGRLIVRAKRQDGAILAQSFSKADGLLYTFERLIFDFDVQMYHEVLDHKRKPQRRGLPKVEYSGTLHKGASQVIFVVLDSQSMDDVRDNEGMQMVHVPLRDGLIDHAAGARKIGRLIENRDLRRKTIEENRCHHRKLGMLEVAFGYYILMGMLRGGTET